MIKDKSGNGNHFHEAPTMTTSPKRIAIVYKHKDYADISTQPLSIRPGDNWLPKAWLLEDYTTEPYVPHGFSPGDVAQV